MVCVCVACACMQCVWCMSHVYRVHVCSVCGACKQHMSVCGLCIHMDACVCGGGGGGAGGTHAGCVVHASSICLCVVCAYTWMRVCVGGGGGGAGGTHAGCACMCVTMVCACRCCVCMHTFMHMFCGNDVQHQGHGSQETTSQLANFDTIIHVNQKCYQSVLLVISSCVMHVIQKHCKKTIFSDDSMQMFYT